MFSLKSKLTGVIASLALVSLLPVVAFAFQPPAGTTPARTASPAAASDEGAEVDPAAAFAEALGGADVARGKVVYQRTGLCLNCHGWDGNGTGRNPRSEGQAALLRETQLDAQGLYDIIRCGIPGTPMPYHNNQAYVDPEICYGMVKTDFEGDDMPNRGKTFRDADAINLVAYMLESIVGAGETTLAQCEAFFGPGAAGCNSLR